MNSEGTFESTHRTDLIVGRTSFSRIFIYPKISRPEYETQFFMDFRVYEDTGEIRLSVGVGPKISEIFHEMTIGK